MESGFDGCVCNNQVGRDGCVRMWWDVSSVLVGNRDACLVRVFVRMGVVGVFLRVVKT